MKKKIQDIFVPGVVSVSPDTPAAKVMALMRDRKISCILITENEVPVGIFTERDVVRFIVQRGFGFTGASIAEVMTPRVITVTPDSMLFEAFGILADNTIRHLVVVDDEKRAIGIITQSDLLDDFGYDYFVRVRTVDQIMNKRTLTAEASDTVFNAARAMSEQRLSFLIICADSRPVGVITERDIARFVADGFDLTTMDVEQGMSHPVHTVGHLEPAESAAEKMHRHDIRHLVVVDRHDKAVGVITQTDLVRGLESRFIETLKTVIKEQSAELDKTVLQLAQKTIYLDSILSSSINIGIAATDRDLRISYFNNAAESILATPANAVLGKRLQDIHVPENVPFIRLEKALDKVRGRGTYSFVITRDNSEGRKIIQAKLSGIHDKEGLIGFLLMLEDITAKRLAEKTIHRLAYYDLLTGIPNRTLFYERLNSELARSQRSGAPFSVVLMDVDRFKEVNDTLGHHAGDKLLQEIASRLSGLLRETDTVARLGGDEFCFILLNGASAEAAITTVSKVIDRLSPPYDLENEQLTVTFSLGIALYPACGTTDEKLLRRADAAMYQAKELGRENERSNFVVADAADQSASG